MAQLVVQDLESGYGDTQVLFGVSLKVESGTITTLLGSNGAGKTTTLWTIMSVVEPWKGTVMLDGKNITYMPTHEKVHLGLVLVPEGRRLWPDLTVEENLLLASLIPRAREKREESLEMVYQLFPRLRERRKQKAGTLSGGEQQMLAIARGLMLRPEILMLDEPSLGLAPKLVQEIADVVKRLRDEQGLTVLLVEQNIHIALKIADYGYLLENGRIVLEGTPEELEKNPKIKEAYLGL